MATSIPHALVSVAAKTDVRDARTIDPDIAASATCVARAARDACDGSRTFAQMGLCDAKTIVPPDCRRTVAGALFRTVAARRAHRAVRRRGAHRRSRASTKALKKSRFLHAPTTVAAAAAALRAPATHALGACAGKRAAPAPENNRAGVLTVEKTVIRFRPSRRCCRNE
ncbi:hypothetical protein [Luteimonas sp. R10]|uniref:hypothetical protein n=1 Tax=Luteimonas sp. R10 TaxID=3108176 RepID=UPI00308AACAB|nr:hypothetical protein U3649_17640 [Luteimonas sp. R10]